MDSLTVLRRQRDHVAVLPGSECLVTHHVTPHAETRKVEGFYFPSMKPYSYDETTTYATDAVQLTAYGSVFSWGRKVNGKSSDKYARERIRIAKPGASERIAAAKAAMLAAQQMYKETLQEAWDEAQQLTKARAKRLVKEWPEAKHEIAE